MLSIGPTITSSIPDEAFIWDLINTFDSKIHQPQQWYDFQYPIFKEFGTMRAKVLFSSCILFENRSRNLIFRTVWWFLKSKVRCGPTVMSGENFKLETLCGKVVVYIVPWHAIVTDSTLFPIDIPSVNFSGLE